MKMDLTKARDGSLSGKYIALAFLLLATVARGLGWLKFLDQGEIILTSLGIVALFAPVDLNLLAEKVFKVKRDE